MPLVCIICSHTDQDSPMIAFQYQGEKYWICSEHFPLLIHHPEQLVDKLPGYRSQVDPVENA